MHTLDILIHDILLVWRIKILSQDSTTIVQYFIMADTSFLFLQKQKEWKGLKVLLNKIKMYSVLGIPIRYSLKLNVKCSGILSWQLLGTDLLQNLRSNHLQEEHFAWETRSARVLEFLNNAAETKEREIWSVHCSSSVSNSRILSLTNRKREVNWFDKWWKRCNKDLLLTFQSYLRRAD